MAQPNQRLTYRRYGDRLRCYPPHVRLALMLAEPRAVLDEMAEAHRRECDRVTEQRRLDVFDPSLAALVGYGDVQIGEPPKIAPKMGARRGRRAEPRLVADTLP